MISFSVSTVVALSGTAARGEDQVNLARSRATFARDISPHEAGGGGRQCEEAVRWKVLRLASTIRLDRQGIFSRGCRDSPAPSNRAGPDYHAGHGHELQVREKSFPSFSPFFFFLFSSSSRAPSFSIGLPVSLLVLRRLSLSLSPPSLFLSLESRGKSGTRTRDWTSAETRKFLRGIFPRACHIFNRQIGENVRDIRRSRMNESNDLRDDRGGGSRSGFRTSRARG